MPDYHNLFSTSKHTNRRRKASPLTLQLEENLKCEERDNVNMQMPLCILFISLLSHPCLLLFFFFCLLMRSLYHHMWSPLYQAEVHLGAICWGQPPKQCHPESAGYICSHLWHCGIEAMVSQRLASLMCWIWTLSSAVPALMPGLGEQSPLPPRLRPFPLKHRLVNTLAAITTDFSISLPLDLCWLPYFLILNTMPGKRGPAIFHLGRGFAKLSRKWNWGVPWWLSR